jgi:hypothetical protein
MTNTSFFFPRKNSVIVSGKFHFPMDSSFIVFVYLSGQSNFVSTRYIYIFRFQELETFRTAFIPNVEALIPTCGKTGLRTLYAD